MPSCTVVTAAGNVVWSDDRNLVSVTRLGTGWYRVRFNVDVSNDALFAQPLALHTDVPRSLLAWMALDGLSDLHVRIDAHYLGGGTGTPHGHRDDLDLRFSLMRCARGGRSNDTIDEVNPV